jgi:hypothetical protein
MERKANLKYPKSEHLWRWQHMAVLMLAAVAATPS